VSIHTASSNTKDLPENAFRQGPCGRRVGDAKIANWRQTPSQRMGPFGGWRYAGPRRVSVGVFPESRRSAASGDGDPERSSFLESRHGAGPPSPARRRLSTDARRFFEMAAAAGFSFRAVYTTHNVMLRPVLHRAWGRQRNLTIFWGRTFSGNTLRRVLRGAFRQRFIAVAELRGDEHAGDSSDAGAIPR
jgi:hypothetical protein